jgi:uncharacterized protein
METVITVENRPELGQYEIYSDGVLAGFTAYESDGSDVAFMHTEIDPAFEGEGLARQLIQQALDDVRAKGETAEPFCPFVRRFIATHPEYVDLVPAERRSAFGFGG